MSFFNRERSHHGGAPIELYDFYQGTIHWRYTNADREIVFDGFVWKPIPIKRQKIQQTPEMSKVGLRIEAPRTIEVYERFRVAAPGSAVTCSVYTFHYEDAQAVPEWTGKIISCLRKESSVTFIGEPVYASMKTTGLRRNWQRSCPHLLYGPGCRVVKELYVVEVPVLTMAGVNLSVSLSGGYPDFYFEGGYAEWLDELGLPVFRGIELHSGNDIILSYTPVALVVGQTIKLYPGCNHTMSMCDERFDNLVNYGGTPYIPEKNPYSGAPVY